MSAKERDGLEVMRRLGRGEIRQVEAAPLMGLSPRQVRRLERRTEREGDCGLVHRARGRPSNRRMPEEIEARAKAHLRQKCSDFGPTLAREHLAQDDSILLGRTTVTRDMHGEHLFAARREPRPHRRRRERRACFGELVPRDTSEHAWFEDRAPACSLIDMIDDATGWRLLRLFAADTTEANFSMIQRGIEAFGRPRALYTDEASHFRPPPQRGKRPSLRQIERALQSLGVGLIIARSPQAKGRVERAHGIDQDRLVKELRLGGLSTIEEANRFLDEVSLPRMNGRFAVRPRRRRDAHLSARGFDLAAILCPHETRRVANDHTVSIDRTLWQIQAEGPSLASPTIVVERRLDGPLRLRHGERSLAFRRAARAGEMPPWGQPPKGPAPRAGKTRARFPQFPSPGGGEGQMDPGTARNHPGPNRTFLLGEKPDISTRR